jgi:hypothetical protein
MLYIALGFLAVATIAVVVGLYLYGLADHNSKLSPSQKAKAKAATLVPNIPFITPKKDDHKDDKKSGHGDSHGGHGSKSDPSKVVLNICLGLVAFAAACWIANLASCVGRSVYAPPVVVSTIPVVPAPSIDTSPAGLHMPHEFGLKNLFIPKRMCQGDGDIIAVLAPNGTSGDSIKIPLYQGWMIASYSPSALPGHGDNGGSVSLCDSSDSSTQICITPNDENPTFTKGFVFVKNLSPATVSFSCAYAYKPGGLPQQDDVPTRNSPTQDKSSDSDSGSNSDSNSNS